MSMLAWVRKEVSILGWVGHQFMNDCMTNTTIDARQPAGEPTHDDNPQRNPRKLNLLICPTGRSTQAVGLCEYTRKSTILARITKVANVNSKPCARKMSKACKRPTSKFKDWRKFRRCSTQGGGTTKLCTFHCRNRAGCFPEEILYRADNALMCKVFAMILRGAAQDWFYTLPSGSISSFKELAYVFPKKYTSYIKKNLDHLYHMYNLDRIASSGFKKGLPAEHELNRELTITPSQALVEAFATVERYALWDDDRIATKKSTKKEDQPIKWRSQRSNRFSNRNKDKRRSLPTRRRYARRELHQVLHPHASNLGPSEGQTLGKKTAVLERRLGQEGYHKILCLPWDT
ncbi:unnamed protein product [Prunus armeniaca]